MAEGGPPSKRARLGKEDLNALSKDELLERCEEQESTIEMLTLKLGADTKDELKTLRESEEQLRQQQSEATLRENVLVMRLTAKEQQLQDYMNQIEELKQANNPMSSKVREMLLAPAVNLMFKHMKKEMDVCKEKLEQAQNDLAAWKFTPDSQTGKRLMAKCRMLLSENEELGKVIASGRIAKLEGEISLEKKFVDEMKISQAETDEFLVDMDEDLEGMQSTIYLLQQQLKDAKMEIAHLQKEKAALCREHIPAAKYELSHSANSWSPADNRTTISETRADVTCATVNTTLVTTNGCHMTREVHIDKPVSIDLNRDTDSTDSGKLFMAQTKDVCNRYDSHNPQHNTSVDDGATEGTDVSSDASTSPSHIVDTKSKLLNQYSSNSSSSVYRTEGLASVDCMANGVTLNQQYDSERDEHHDEAT